MKKLFLVCGVSGCGKSWACRQCTDRFHYIPHDRCWSHPEKPSWDPKMVWAADMKDDSRYLPGAKSTHLEVLVMATKIAMKPVLTECPFAERVLREQLEQFGIEVVPIFVIESPALIAERYQRREGKQIPKAAFTRAGSIVDRAREWGSFFGTSNEVLAHLKKLNF